MLLVRPIAPVWIPVQVPPKDPLPVPDQQGVSSAVVCKSMKNYYVLRNRHGGGSALPAPQIHKEHRVVPSTLRRRSVSQRLVRGTV